MVGSRSFLRVPRLLSSVKGVTADRHPDTQAFSLALKNAIAFPTSFASSSSSSLQVLPKISSSSSSAPPQRPSPTTTRLKWCPWGTLPPFSVLLSPPHQHLKWLPPSWMYLSMALECKLRDAGDLVWPGQYYVFTMKQNFFIKWVKCIPWAVSQACRDSSSAPAFCLAGLFHHCLLPLNPPLSDRNSSGFPDRGSLSPGVLLSLHAWPSQQLSPWKQSTWGPPSHTRLSSSSLCTVTPPDPPWVCLVLLDSANLWRWQRGKQRAGQRGSLLWF